MSDQNGMQPWQWSEQEWRRIVTHVRAGRRLRPDKWKGGARVAVALSFDSDHETNELRDGGSSVNRLSWGQYGNRVGVPRILSLLEKYSVPVSFYVPAVSALLYPDEQRRIVDAGHEIGVHGWIHELNSKLEFVDERDLLGRSMDTLEKITGKRPTGFRSPSGDFSKNTLQILQELGFSYDSSLSADDDCYELEMDGEPTGLVEIPFDWVRDDAVYFLMHRFQGLRPYTPPSDVFDIFRRELDAAYAEGGLFELTMHPHVITNRSRIWIVEELIRYAKSLPDGVWFARHDEVVNYVLQNAKLR
ncbi:polysaccharide deacetylase family protein [Burkholderia plantarii]|uniref:polysaccharide deacetylase family protein n=1 Tax=Burkholderia plantarii TaxID=41899 RepID=UPI0006D89A2E|nr:polysaccharide deacetylase [Burkholderia plantarii]ALK32465.1 polysaccharide deacetylase [Burkholderia plantarii]